jgi:hypothetical protein
MEHRETNQPEFRERPPHIPQEWWEEFEAASRRTVEERWRYGFVKTYKPVMDDAPFRSFETMEDYRRWCEDNLPEWLGYHRAKPDVDETQG